MGPLLTQKPSHKLSLTQGMLTSLKVLSLPLVELEQFLRTEIEQNPLLEEIEESAEVPEAVDVYRELDFETMGFDELEMLDERFTEAVFPESEEYPIQELTAFPVSLYEDLLNQAREVLCPQQMSLAEELIGNLDERGFYTLALTSIQEEILKKIQELDPPGIGARNIQEALCIQLERMKKKESLAYHIVKRGFEDFLFKRWEKLARELNVDYEEIVTAIYEEIGSLDFFPARKFFPVHSPAIQPDLFLMHDGTTWQFTLEEGLETRIKVHSLPGEHLTSARKLLSAIKRRKETLLRIADALFKLQGPYLLAETDAPSPLTLKELASSLSLHESSVSRAVQHKYLHCPRGLIALSSCFSSSDEKAKQLLKQLIFHESKKKPLSDALLMKLLQQKGVTCQRRTIAKYRGQLKIPAAYLRKLTKIGVKK